MIMDDVDIDSTLKDLDELESNLFQSSLKKVPELKPRDEKTDTAKKCISKLPSKGSADEFSDDDIADLLSDADDIFGRPKGAKAASLAAAEQKKIGKQSSHSFDSLDVSGTTKESPSHEERRGRQLPRAKDSFDKDDSMDADFEKNLFSGERQKHSTFHDDVFSPKKQSLKEDQNFPTTKGDGLKNETPAQSTQLQKKKDEVNFDDSELLDDLGLDDLLAKPSRTRSNPGPSEKKGSFLDDLLGGTKKEQNVPPKKQQEFALDQKYKSPEKHDDSDLFGFGSYVPSSATPSAPTSRRKSVKFDDEPFLPRSGPAASRHKSFTKQDSFLDDPGSSLNKSPRRSVATERDSTKQDSVYRSPEAKGSSLNTESSQKDNFLKRSGNPLANDTTPSRSRDENTNWLNFLKDDKGKEWESPKHRSLDFQEKPSPKGNDDVLGQRRRSSGADWLGLGKTGSSGKSENLTQSASRANVNKPPQQPNILNAVDPKSPEPRQVQKQMPGISSVRQSDMAPLEQFVPSIKRTPSVGVPESEVALAESKPPLNPAVDHQSGVGSNVPVLGSVASQQTIAQQMNMNVPSVPQYATVEVQNNFLAFQSMINSLQLEKEQLMKSMEALKLRHEEEVKTLESSQKNQMKTAEESSKNQEKRLKEEYEAKIQNLESQVKDIMTEKTDVTASHKEKIDELKKEHYQEIQRLKDLQSQAISAMKEDHKNALSRLKQLKDQEVEAISSTQVYARSLQHLTDQLEARASELATLQLKVDERHQKSLQDRQNVLDAKDKELKELKKKLDKQLEESEEERARLQQLVLRLESRLQQVTKEGEEEKWNLQQTQAKLEIKKKMLDEEQIQALQKIEREREKLKISQESLLQEQKTVLLQLAQERQQLSSEKMEMDLLSKRLKEEESRLQSARLKGEANIEAEKRSLLREKENLEIERARIRQESHQLQLGREDVERERRQLQEEKEKLVDQKYNLHRRTQEIEDMNQNAKLMKSEAKMALSAANKMESDQNAQVEQIRQQLAALQSKETQILMEKSSLAEERKMLEMKKDSLLCANCKLSLSRPFSGFPSDIAVHQITSPLPLPNIQTVTGIQTPGNVDPSLLWWYVTAQKDKEYLTNEQLFIQSLHESSRKKREFV